MVKKTDKKKKLLKKRVKKVVKQTQTQKQTVVVNIDTKKTPIRRRAPTPRQKPGNVIERIVRMNEPPQTLLNTGAMGMLVREPLKNPNDYSLLNIAEKTKEQRESEMIENNMKFLDKLESANRQEKKDIGLGRETESEKATTLPDKAKRGRPRVEKTEEQKKEERRVRNDRQRERRQQKKNKPINDPTPLIN